MARWIGHRRSVRAAWRGSGGDHFDAPGIPNGEIAVMTARKRPYSAADLAEVSDSPEWTEEEFRSAKTLDEILPELAAAMRRGRGKQKAPTKVQVTLRLDRATVEAFRLAGDGWQARMNAALKRAAPRHG